VPFPAFFTHAGRYARILLCGWFLAAFAVPADGWFARAAIRLYLPLAPAFIAVPHCACASWLYCTTFVLQLFGDEHFTLSRHRRHTLAFAPRRSIAFYT
jgi:hypothetical protein